MDRYLMVMLGAGLGGMMRYALGYWITAKYEGRFPLGTFTVNVIGCFFMGLVMTYLTERIQPHPHWRLFLVVGVLGGFTTFSSFGYETLQAVRHGAPRMALAYVLGSVLFGYAAVWLGMVLASRK